MNKKSQTELIPVDNELVNLLRKALEDEWKSAFQYEIHASRFRGLYNVSEHMEEHAEDEREHADRLTMHFYSHGIPIDITIPEINPGKETIEMITKDLEEEVKTIDQYTKIAKLCEDRPELTDTRMLIEDILVDEVEHQDDNAAFIRAIVEKREEALKYTEKVALANAFVKTAEVMDDLGLDKYANKYTEILKGIISK